jgi:hypothetical protein
MYSEALLPLAKQRKISGMNVRARDWSSLKAGDVVTSVMGYSYNIGSNERQTLQNKVIAMLAQKLENARFNKKIVQILIDDMINDETELEPISDPKRQREITPSSESSSDTNTRPTSEDIPTDDDATTSDDAPAGGGSYQMFPRLSGKFRSVFYPTRQELSNHFSDDSDDGMVIKTKID